MRTSDHARYPSTLFVIPSSHPLYAQRDQRGRSPRFALELLDGDEFFFTNLKAARRFAKEHALLLVAEEMLKWLREGGVDEAGDP